MQKIVKIISVAFVASYLTFSAYGQTKAIDPSNIDASVKPCDDFFMYANGGWLKKNPIPASESRWGSFNELDNKNNLLLRDILEDASKKASPKGSIEQKVGDYYFSAMDSLAIEKAGIGPIKPELDKIAKVKTIEELLSLNNYNLIKESGAIYGVYVGQDDKNSTRYSMYFIQGGLGLPDRDYYLKDDKRSQNIREEYKKHVEKMLILIGQSSETARQNASKIINLETELAKGSMTRVQLRDPYATYNKMSVADFAKLSPKFNWKKRFSELKVLEDSIIVGQPEFFKKANRMLDSVSLNDWKSYLQWHFVHSMASALSSPFVKENFNFYGSILQGTKALQPRWKRMVRSTNADLGEALGQLYVAKAFSPKAKEKALEMVNNIKWAFKQHIQKADWMSAETKQRAVEKLNAFVVKIGYPDKWKDYSALNIERGAHAMNVLRAAEFESKEDLNKLGKPIDRTEWHMSPPTINAYYNPNMNEIVFPAGILQPPFFNPNADDAVNYGGIGAVIGHEITHGFDDQGRQFDPVGNLKDWWTEEDGKNFDQRAEVLEKQFSSFEVLDSVFINGKLTLGENIADLGGISIAYTALQKALQEKHPGNIDGFTPEQRFFLGFAQVWRMNVRDEYLRQQVLTDPHSPARFRTNGPLSNFSEFHKAFNCKPGDKMMMNEGTRAKIW
jgi:putative endopeptidase